MARRKRLVTTFRGALAGEGHLGVLDVDASVESGRNVHARLGQCYSNASLASWAFRNDEALYVEGYAILRGVLIEHGWLLVGGKVIDPTVAALKDGVMFDQYVPVLVWTLEDMSQQASEQGVMPLGDWCIAGWEQSVTLTREEVASAWQTAALGIVGYAGAAADFHKEISL